MRLTRLVGRLLVATVVLTAVIVLPWRWLSPPSTAFMIRERFRSPNPVHYSWTDLEDISPNLAIAAVAAEDQKFPTHHGFDVDQIFDAVRRRSEGRSRGASTISQQVAKNMFLWPGQSFIRKGIEAYLTVWIEVLWPKERILEIYLNVAEFGPGIYGAGAAAGHAFDKPARELTLQEAAILVAVLPSPGRMSIKAPSDYVQERARQIVRAAEALGGTAYLSGL